MLKVAGLRRVGVTGCRVNLGHVILNASHDVIDCIPLEWVELMWACPHESAKGQRNFVDNYCVAG